MPPSSPLPLLFLTPELPYPPRSGGRIKSFRLVEHLSRRFALTVGAVLKGDDADHLAAFKAAVPLVDDFYQPVQRSRSVVNLSMSYGRGEPLNIYRTASRAFARQVAHRAPRQAVIVLDHYEVSQFLPRDYRGGVVLHQHNAYHQLWARYAAGDAPGLRRLVAALEARRVGRYEVRACGRADVVLAAPNDIDSLAALGVDRQRCRETFHLGDETNLGRPPLAVADTEPLLLYVGTLSWEANAHGLLWFLEGVWPTLKARHPALQLAIAGRGAPPALERAVAEAPGVSLLGFVDDLEPWLTRARLCIAPLRFGAGIKVKVLNALARGLPTLTTTTGAEGLAVVDGVHLAIADTPAASIAAAEGLLTDDHHWQAMSRAARDLVAARYTWDRVLAGVDGAIAAALAAAEARGLSPSPSSPLRGQP